MHCRTHILLLLVTQPVVGPRERVLQDRGTMAEVGCMSKAYAYTESVSMFCSDLTLHNAQYYHVSRDYHT